MSKWTSAVICSAVIGFAGASLAAVPSFEQLDKNKDGKLSQAEASTVGNLDFAKADTDKDGTLSRSEYGAATS